MFEVLPKWRVERSHRALTCVRSFSSSLSRSTEERMTSLRGLSVDGEGKVAVHSYAIIDGGFATALEAQGIGVNDDPLWSAALLADNPQAIEDTHYAFFAAGADVAITASCKRDPAHTAPHPCPARPCGPCLPSCPFYPWHHTFVHIISLLYARSVLPP